MLKQYSPRLAALIILLSFVGESPKFSQDISEGTPVPRQSPTPRKTFRMQVEVSAGSEKIENAKVMIDSEEEGVKFSKDKRTNKQGMVSVTAVPEGRIKVVVVAKDCATFGEVFNLSQDNQTFRVTLTKNAPAANP